MKPACHGALQAKYFSSVATELLHNTSNSSCCRSHINTQRPGQVLICFEGTDGLGGVGSIPPPPQHIPRAHGSSFPCYLYSTTARGEAALPSGRYLQSQLEKWDQG